MERIIQHRSNNHSIEQELEEKDPIILPIDSRKNFFSKKKFISDRHFLSIYLPILVSQEEEEEEKRGKNRNRHFSLEAEIRGACYLTRERKRGGGSFYIIAETRFQV